MGVIGEVPNPSMEIQKPKSTSVGLQEENLHHQSSQIHTLSFHSPLCLLSVSTLCNISTLLEFFFSYRKAKIFHCSFQALKKKKKKKKKVIKDMGILHDDVVLISQSDKEGEPSVITVNCPDKTGLGCDLCRILLFFGLSIVRGDVTEVLCNLELNIKKVKVSTIPDGTVIDLFFVTDTRELLHTKIRQEETYKALEDIMQRIVINFNIEKVGPEIAACSQASPFLPSGITEDIFHLEVSNELPSVSLTSSNVSVVMDNSLSPAHTLVQIVCQDHKGLLYDIMRTLKDYRIQISYGRVYIRQGRKCEIDLFIMQADGKKIVDPSKQSTLSSHLKMELLQPLRVAVVSRGPDTELLVANPVELSSKGRPLVFYDITRALKMLNTCIFSAEVGRHMIGDREWEVYRVLLDEGASLSIPREKVEEGVWKLLMGWE
ncbi:ACT domain-containing protein ACR10 isoform X2 [Gossypium hirsutum]|uniref:ACT domain-containing protein ACR n=1 Tax=Gossypium hirsutum TaxID=3635 RepID=A0A1U8PML7_GOSHI|nr:ACT domain-containing protein ACR10 isoform X2 [Gossypium hirsutum]